MSTLYELKNEYMELIAMLEDTELDPEVIADTLEGVKGEIEVKAEGYAKVIRTLEADKEALQKEADYFTSRAKVVDRNIKKLKEAVKEAVILTGNNELDAGAFKLKIQKNGGKAPIKINEEYVPDSYKVIKYETDSARIREELERGVLLSFAILEDRGSHLVIK